MGGDGCLASGVIGARLLEAPDAHNERHDVGERVDPRERRRHDERAALQARELHHTHDAHQREEQQEQAGLHELDDVPRRPAARGTTHSESLLINRQSESTLLSFPCHRTRSIVLWSCIVFVRVYCTND